MANKTDITACLAMLSAGIPKFVMNADTPATYFDILQDLPAEMLKAATRQYLSERNEYTPVPTPGILREKAMDLHFLALGVPLPSEAWAKVQDARKTNKIGFCEEGAALRTAAESGVDYWKSMWAYKEHTDACKICNPHPTVREDYGHPVTAETVKRLGGLDAILTDNPVADRARFIDAYREIVLRERGKVAMTPEVKDFLAQRTAELDAGVDPVFLIGSRIDDVVQRMRPRKDLE